MDGYRKSVLRLISKFGVWIFILGLVAYVWSMLAVGSMKDVPIIGRQAQGWYFVMMARTEANLNERNRLLAIGQALIDGKDTYQYEVSGPMVGR